MIQVLRSPLAMQGLRKSLNGSVGFVPTMGALHLGHETLIKNARKENDIVVLSIFVNPTQFNNPDDLEKYPQTWESDLEIAKNSGVDYIFFPTYKDMYPDDYRYKVIETDFSKILCGKDRPGHFDGVFTVVLKLLNIVKPDNAYFGKKDFQQLQLIKDMCHALFIDTHIVPIDTVREEDGLAMSSRNVRLSEKSRNLAPHIFKVISNSNSATEAEQELNELGFNVDYVVDNSGRRFVAVRAKAEDGTEVRLIDNVQI